MTLNTISEPPASPGPAATPSPAALPSTAAALAPPPPALLTSGQLRVALGISRRMLKRWLRHQVIPSIGVRHARRYDLEQVMEALRTHGQQAPAAASAAPGMGGPAGLASDCEYHVMPR
ncbi:MAG: helix-turn-helix domain-containing protein [Verrucomicrobia bacterium]|nr:helix-turn-helix domain-containing protein [Verrucomicrobiota bacterium]